MTHQKLIDRTFMAAAVIRSQESHCVSTKVGTLLAKGNRMISVGVNGTPSDKPGRNCQHNCSHMLNENGKLSTANRPEHSAWSNDNEIHAEIYAIMNAHLFGETLNNATMYTTASPCPNCAKHIELYVARGAIGRVVYLDKYDRGNDEWISNLESYGIEVVKMERQDLSVYVDFDKINFSNVE